MYRKYLMGKLKTLFEKYSETKAIFYFFGFAIVSCIIYLPRDLQIHGYEVWSQTSESMFFAWERFLYCFGLTLIILPGLLGSKDIIAKL